MNLFHPTQILNIHNQYIEKLPSIYEQCQDGEAGEDPQNCQVTLNYFV